MKKYSISKYSNTENPFKIRKLINLEFEKKVYKPFLSIVKMHNKEIHIIVGIEIDSEIECSALVKTDWHCKTINRTLIYSKTL